eukprot:m.40995 g.40995  ORF g.40995 m.40995 type:complete len:51 (-) comp18664_c0_seq1:8-160(-)
MAPTNIRTKNTSTLKFGNITPKKKNDINSKSKIRNQKQIVLLKQIDEMQK